MIKHNFLKFLAISFFGVVAILSLQKNVKAATFKWGNRTISTFTSAANNKNNIVSGGLSNGGNGIDASIITKDKNFMARSEVNLTSKRVKDSGLFKASLFTQAGYKIPQGNEPDDWIRGGFKSLAGISFRQPFTVESDNQLEEISAAIWGEFDAEGLFAFGTVGQDSLGSNIIYDLKIENLNTEVWDGTFNEQYKNNELEDVKNAFSKIFTLLNSGNATEIILKDSTVNYFEGLINWWENLDTVGIELDGGAKRLYEDSIQTKNVIVGETYTIKMDILFASSQFDGGYSINNALNSFNTGVWIGDAPEEDPLEIPEPNLILGFLVLSIIFGSSKLRLERSCCKKLNGAKNFETIV